MTTQVAIDSIVWDTSIYPRSKWSTATIDRYAEAMEAGETFPPITIEKGTSRLLDGKHRYEAYKKRSENGKPLKVPVEVRVIPKDVPAKLFAASLSARHGDRVANSDLKFVCREVFTDNPEMNQEGVGKLLGITQQRVSEFVADILARLRESRRTKGLRLSILGWTQQEIAQRLGVSRPLINEDLQKVRNTGSGKTDFFTSGHADEEIGQRLGWPVQLVKAYRYKEAKLTDEDRLDDLGIKTQPYDVWHFAGCHDLMGDKHPGRIPGELVCHVLYFYTKPGDMILDPMAGSGTTLDACLLMGRKARGYDIDLRHDRIDVEEWKLENKWPSTVSKADLIFWDPPYFDKKANEYAEGSVSGLLRKDYLKFFQQSFESLKRQTKRGATLAFLMSDWDSPTDPSDSIFVWDYVDLLFDIGWQVHRHIQIPLSTQQVHPDIMLKKRKSRQLCRLGRSLLICRKSD